MDPERSLLVKIPMAVRFAATDTEQPTPSPASRGRGAQPRRRPVPAPVPELSSGAAALLAWPSGRDRASSRKPRPNHDPAEEYDSTRLLRAAGRVSRQELLARPRGAPRLVAEIDAWLTAHGKQFRPDPPAVSEALAQALAHIETMLDGSDKEAYFAAFVALPELRRSLAARKGARFGAR